MKYKCVPLKTSCWCNLTYHAVEQFIRRHEPEKSQQAAEDELFILLETSKQVDRTPHGDPIFVSGHRPEVRMVVKDRNVCVTVLPIPHGYQPTEPEYWDFYEQELAELQAAADHRRTLAEQEIQEIQAEIAIVDEHRKIWSLKKQELSNRLEKLRHKLKYDL